jgi:hypothetical protein
VEHAASVYHQLAVVVASFTGRPLGHDHESTMLRLRDLHVGI